MDMTFTTYASATGFAYPEMVMQGSGNVPNSQITTSATYNYNTGLPLTVTDANQKTASSEYDSSNWRLKKSVSPTGAYAVEDYDDLNRAYTQTGYSSGGEVVGKQITRVNGLSLPYRQESLSRTNQDGTETLMLSKQNMMTKVEPKGLLIRSKVTRTLTGSIGQRFFMIRLAESRNQGVLTEARRIIITMK
ncbi:MAG: hypothetical protein IPQ00_07130 [Chloracidobacterium sp.]|nr:hypothetical protein [Chloracidobacterium sp.]